ncbi:MAG TPA: NUDIX hydrolase [Sediminispirochaeta sp.]|nr:NUDIX hydrolase [Sediminispirochaeta sp.]
MRSDDQGCVKTTVGALVESDGKLLLERRNHEPFYDHWCIPGGHIDFGETVEHALIREVREETGLQVINYSFFNYFTEYYPDLNWHAVALIFVVYTTGHLKQQQDEVKELRWFNRQEMHPLSFAFEHRRIVGSFYGD